MVEHTGLDWPDFETAFLVALALTGDLRARQSLEDATHRLLDLLEAKGKAENGDPR